MSTTTPPRVLTVPEAREQLIYGLHNASAALGAFWPALDGMAEDDFRWDQLCDRAFERVLPEVAALLDAAIAAEWERTPIEVERRRQPEAGEALVTAQ